MDKGTYKGRRVNFSKYEVSLFTPFLFSSKLSIGMGCGACAISLLTGVSPAFVDASNGNSSHYSDKFVINFLRRLGFSVLGLTHSNVTARRSAIGYHHVILLSQLIRRDEATWGVIYDGRYYHNFEIYHLGLIDIQLIQNSEQAK